MLSVPLVQLVEPRQECLHVILDTLELLAQLDEVLRQFVLLRFNTVSLYDKELVVDNPHHISHHTLMRSRSRSVHKRSATQAVCLIALMLVG